MQRCSETIASLAAALAKAQTELVNPEKLLVGTIRAEGQSGAERRFRYASLSSGLDIVRKILGQHQIAVVQTSAIDQAAGIVQLTTMLAHASGEWIASDWPVCAIKETAQPHRMGAALTYARRYALFTLVGIAGEDDLDAPDLPPSGQDQGKEAPTAATGKGRGNGSGSVHAPHPATGFRRHVKALLDQAKPPPLTTQASAELRDRLLAELGAVGSDEQASAWAQRRLPDKGRLAPADADRVETTFAAIVANLAAAAPPEPPGRDNGTRDRGSPAAVVDKSVLAFPEPRRLRDRNHIRFVVQQPCLVCARQPSDAHHLRFAQSRALGRKVSDEFTVPLCRGHHREVHRCADETAWWQRIGIDASAAARALWLRTHPHLRPADPGVVAANAETPQPSSAPAAPAAPSSATSAPARAQRLRRAGKPQSSSREAKPVQGPRNHGIPPAN